MTRLPARLLGNRLAHGLEPVWCGLASLVMLLPAVARRHPLDCCGRWGLNRASARVLAKNRSSGAVWLCLLIGCKPRLFH